ncbi:hypothetical protein [Maridesulfovibrio sp.]|uniref:hypothetical protein n=1 Tax=Maridesulfovibrio sp. TaxID=2795000 RepID=UPI0039F0CB24
MAKRESLTKIDRLWNAAFWHWEYMRRNPIYIKYWDNYARYLKCFEDIGELGFINSSEHFELACSNSPDEESDNIDLIIEKMFKADGDKGVQNYIKFGCLSNGFAKKFFMPPKTYVEEYSCDYMLEHVFECDDFLFKNYDVYNCISLCSTHEWMFRAPDPVTELYDFAILDNLIFSPSKMASNNLSKNVGLEAGVINVTKSVINTCINFSTSGDCSTVEKIKESPEVELDDVVSDEQLEEIYDLIIKPRKLNIADELRLCGLWMWDNYDHDTDDPEAEFERVLDELRMKLELGGKDDSPWNQVFERKKRMWEYFQVTCMCIKKHTVLPLSYK